MIGLANWTVMNLGFSYIKLNQFSGCRRLEFITMQIKTKKQNNTFFIEISGDFKFDCNADFRKARQEIEPTMKSIVVDLQNVDYVDSASLGMLLILRDLALNNKQDLQLIGAKGIVRKTLEVANFGKLITMKD